MVFRKRIAFKFTYNCNKSFTSGKVNRRFQAKAKIP